MVHFVPLSENVVFKKMNYSNMPEIFSNLKRDWPHSIHTYFFLMNFMDWTEYNWTGQFSFYCPNGDSSIGSVLAIAEFKDSETFVSYHCVDYVSCKAVQDGLRNSDVVNWNKPLIFEAIHERLVPGLKEIIEAKGLKVNKDDKCHQVWMPPEKAKTILVELQSELYFQPLDENQTELIHKNWDYSGPTTEVIVRDSLANNAGLGILFRENDSFAGWAVEQHYGGIGMLFIHPEFRRQGYAIELVKGMVSRAIDREIDPFAVIEKDNNHSRHLFEKLRFENICMVHWIGVQKQ